VSGVDLAPRTGYVLTGKSTGLKIKPMGKKIKQGKVVATGRLKGATPSRDRIKIRVKGKRWKGSSSVRVRKRGRFTGRVRVRRPGRYAIVARHAETGKTRWPGRLRVRRKHLR
jgi:cytoskeletal protein CcmA (bactofilin family)